MLHDDSGSSEEVSNGSGLNRMGVNASFSFCSFNFMLSALRQSINQLQQFQIKMTYIISFHHAALQGHVIAGIGRHDLPDSRFTYVADRKGHDMRYAIDPTKIHNDLGWLPDTKFEDGIKKTIRWYLDNKPWWEEIILGEYQNYYAKKYGNRS